MRLWKDCRGLLELFSVPKSAGAERFVELVETGALLLHDKEAEGRYGLADVERAYMSKYRLSPLLYWSPMKKALRPLFEAGGDTLRALGVPVVGEPKSCHDLAAAVAAVLVADMGR